MSDALMIDGSFDWSGGVDSSKVTTIASDLNPNGLKRNQLAWLNNATVRSSGILQSPGWQPIKRLLDAGGYWQGGFIYEPDGANPYLVCQVSGRIYQALLEQPFTITDLSAVFGLVNPADPNIAEMAWFCQGENYLIIQAGDFYTQPNLHPAGSLNAYGQALAIGTSTLPLIWNGGTLRRSRGITSLVPAIAPNINEIPGATCMDYYGGRIWYAQARAFMGGDMVGGPSGNAVNFRRDAILNVTENPLCFGGDGFTVPTNAGNIRALKHSANINASLGEGQFYIFTRKAVYTLTVPVTRNDWINADVNNQPDLLIVQLVNGAVGDRCVVPVNGDLYYQSLDPAIRSLKRAVQGFEQPGNTAISQNEQRALQLNDRSLMRFSSGVQFDMRLLNAILPRMAADGVNVVHDALAVLDFDQVTNFEEQKPPVWEGVRDGFQVLQLFEGDFGGLQRGFAVAISDLDGAMVIWEMTTASRTQNGDNRVTWNVETPHFTWSQAGQEFRLKQLSGGKLWVDKVAGTVEMTVYYRVDADPCWRFWHKCQFCASRCEDLYDSPILAYPCEPKREGYAYTTTLPEPPLPKCDSMNVRPTTVGYQFQVKFLFKGWCRVRGIMLHALRREEEQYSGICCQPDLRLGMDNLPDPFPPT